MSAAKLVRMANSIATFFRSYPHDEAVSGIRDHVQAFWTPKMRTALAQAVTAGEGGIDPLVAAAMTAPSPGRSPAARESQGPADLGAMGAVDAG